MQHFIVNSYQVIKNYLYSTMKRWIFSFILLCSAHCVMAQREFTGIAKYIMTVEGDSAKRVDSMAVVFGKSKIKIIFYLPNTGNWGIPSEKVFIDDLLTDSTFDIEPDSGTYTVYPIKKADQYEFSNTSRYDAVKRYICFVYKANPQKLDKEKIISAECLGSIDFYNNGIKNYSFLGVQPLIVDNRVVMDYTVVQKDGLKPKFYLYDIKKIENVEEYFSLEGLIRR